MLRDEIAKTTREYDPTFVGIDSNDINCMLYATQLLMRIEVTAAEQSLTMKECNDIAATHGSERKRADAARKLIKTVAQWMTEDAEAVTSSRKRTSPMPALLGGTTTAAAAGQPGQSDDDHMRGGGAVPADETTKEADAQMEREQHERDTADWRRQQYEREQQLEAHALELQHQLQDQQELRHRQQQERQQQQDEAGKLEQQRQRLAKQRQELE